MFAAVPAFAARDFGGSFVSAAASSVCRHGLDPAYLAWLDWADAFREWESSEANAELQFNIEMSSFFCSERDDK